MMDKEISYYAFQMLYWCGIRLGKMLALTKEESENFKYSILLHRAFPG